MSASSDNNVYIKSGRKYVPFGIRYDQKYLPDGIWFVRHYDHSIGTANADHYLRGLFKVGDAPGVVDIPRLCSMQTYVDYVLQNEEFKKLISNERGVSLLDLTAKITALVVKLNDSIKQEAKKHDMA